MRQNTLIKSLDFEKSMRTAENRDLVVQTAIMQLSVRGYKPYQIMEELKISQREFADHYKTVTDAWRHSINTDSAEFFGKILAGYMEVIDAAWKAWELSLKPKERTKLKAVRTGSETGISMDVTEQDDTTEGSSGNPKYLEVIGRQWSNIARLTGQEKAVTMMLQQNTFNVTDSQDEFNNRIEIFRQNYAATHDGGGTVPLGDGSEQPVDSERQNPNGKTD